MELRDEAMQASNRPSDVYQVVISGSSYFRLLVDFPYSEPPKGSLNPGSHVQRVRDPRQGEGSSINRHFDPDDVFPLVQDHVDP